MDLLVLLKQLTAVGLSPAALVGIGILWQINNKFNHFDTRITIIETDLKRRSGD